MTRDEEVTLEAIEAVYLERFPRFVQVAEAISGDPRLAPNLVQEAVAGVIRGRSRFRGSSGVETRLWAAVVDKARKARRGGSAPAGAEGGDRAASELRRALGGLSSRQRQVLFLRYFGDLDQGAIAEVLEMSPGNVGATLNQAHATLSRLLAEAHR